MDIQYRADNYKPNNQKLDVEILINQNPKNEIPIHQKADC